ncbi:MAG: aminopeptidase [Bacteroidota bacterium]|nr:aminopeptidase [Bacteroidota bacterium]
MKLSLFRKIRIIFFDVLRFGIVLLCILFCPLIVYGLRMAKGQGTIILNARPVKEVIADPAVPDSVKAKLLFIGEVRQFAFDSIGLRINENYTSFYDQHGKRLMYVVTACKPFALEPHLWHFPVLGDVPYKGFFDAEKAKEEALLLQKKGLDTDVGGASGWSTLGFFKDPILSQMLNNKEGDLAELIIHELTHGTIFVTDDVDFNENLASFIGYKGALWFLERKFGKDSPQLKTYLNGRHDEEVLEKFMLGCAHSLDSLYKNFPSEASGEGKITAKRRLMISFMLQSKKLPLEMDSTFPARFGNRMMRSGNAFFMQYVRYGSKQHDFENDFLLYNGDLRKYVNEMKAKYLKN